MIHLEHCPGCSDPLCRVIRGAEVTSNRDEVTCKVCRKIFDLKPFHCDTWKFWNRIRRSKGRLKIKQVGLQRKKK